MHRAVAQYNKVFVVESLGAGDLHSGAHLVQEIQPTVDRLGLGICFWDAPGRAAFRAAFDQIRSQCERDSPRTFPLVHVDAHGGADGIALASGETMAWDEFAGLCRRVNVASTNNLVITSCACYGMKAITEVKIAEPAPFFALIAAESTLAAKHADMISVFYNELLRSGDVDEALKRVGPPFGMFLAERLLVRSYAKYLRKESMGAGRRHRVERLMTLAAKVPGIERLTLAARRRLIKESAMPDAASFERFKARFLLSDVPENAERFTSTFDDVRRLANDPSSLL